MAEIKLTKSTYEQEVNASEKTVLIDFFATWCGPCQMMAPTVEQISEEYEEKLKVCVVNVDEEPELAEAFAISAIPTLAVVAEGKVKEISVGYKTKEQILGLLQGKMK
ncbi:MAG: thioredoxin [Clostridia bacterium]|nr:thioredoxin [Clostridia bacterium]